MSKHTLGPWTALAEGGDEEGASVWFIYGEPRCSPADVAEDHCTHDPCYDGYVCEVASDELDSEALRANANLIAAAPDLLAELENIANADPSKWDPEMRDQFREWAQSRARHAIAKVEGRGFPEKCEREK